MSPSPNHARRWSVLLVVLALVVGAGVYGYRALSSAIRGTNCTVTAAGNSESFTPEQTGNAAIITAVSIERGMPARAATIALATAYQESKIVNINYGDRDSVGLFQQRPSQGWGTVEQIMDPVYSTNRFYDELVKLEGYENADITTVAQRVQRSAYPEAYRDHEGQGRVLASALTGHSPAGLTCRLDPAAAGTGTDAGEIAADLAEQMGQQAQAQGAHTLVYTGPSQELAWAVGQWAVARAQVYGIEKVSVGGRTWDRAGDAGWSGGAATQTVTITVTS